MEISGISFYDFLGKLVPGTLLWAPWVLFAYCENRMPSEEFSCGTFLIYFILLTGFYLTGIIWHFLMTNVVFKCLRLRPCMLEIARNLYYTKSGRKESMPDSTDDKQIKRGYIAAYYKCLKNGILRDLPVMESHENFLKTNWILTAYYAVLAGLFLPETWNIVVMSFLCCVVLIIPFIWYKTQIKIYYAVWEAEDNIKA